MKETISPEVIKKAQTLMSTMPAQTNIIEIPGCNGLTLLRLHSEEFKKKEKEVFVMFFEIPGNDEFCICTK